MAQNSISYEGRAVSTTTRPFKLTQTTGGMTILEFTVAEQHSMKKGRAKKDSAMKEFVEDERNIAKTDDDWINTTVSWHRLTIFGEKAEALATNDEFGHGALIVVDNASYVEEVAYWSTRDGVQRAGRPETIGDQKGEIEIKFPPRDPQGALWDGASPLPKPGGNGPREDREVAEDEGF